MTVPILVAACIFLAVVVVVLGIRFARRDPPSGADPPAPVLDPSARGPVEILERMTVGVLLLNASLTPIMANPVARSLLQLPGPTLPARLRSDELVSIA